MKRCVCCGDDRVQTVYKWRAADQSNVEMKRCLSCGLVYQDPMQKEEELRLLYNEEFFSIYEKYFLDFRKKQFRRDIDVINAMKPPPGNLLDIGCAFGLFLDEAHKRGWNVSGLDVSSDAVEYAKKRYGLDIFLGTLAEAKFNTGSFDVVTAWDVIEHLADPSVFLDEVSRVTKSGGILAIRTPNAEALFLKINKLVNSLFGDYFAKVGPKFDHHKYLFSADSLRKLLKSKGFEVIDIRLELEDIIIVDNPNLVNYTKAFVKKIIKLLEFFYKKRRASIVVYARKI